MAIDLTNTDDQIRTIVMILEIILIIMLLLARYNIRRLNIGNHHKLVYSSVLINTLIILFWMLPRELNLLQRILDGKTDPFAVWYVLFHAFFGSIAIILGIFLCTVFLLKVVRQEMLPLFLIRRMKPIMITTIIFWSLAFIFGLYIYVNRALRPP